MIAPLICDLCGEPMQPHEFSRAVRDTTGMDVCCLCLEEMTYEGAIHTRAEMGLVGSIGSRP